MTDADDESETVRRPRGRAAPHSRGVPKVCIACGRGTVAEPVELTCCRCAVPVHARRRGGWVPHHASSARPPPPVPVRWSAPGPTAPPASRTCYPLPRCASSPSSRSGSARPASSRRRCWTGARVYAAGGGGAQLRRRRGGSLSCAAGGAPTSPSGGRKRARGDAAAAPGCITPSSPTARGASRGGGAGGHQGRKSRDLALARGGGKGCARRRRCRRRCGCRFPHRRSQVWCGSQTACRGPRL